MPKILHYGWYPRLPGGKRKKFNVYAKTKAGCEKKLAKMIAEKKAEIAKMKKKSKNGIMHKWATTKGRPSKFATQ